jgi:hypothetical protein
VPLSAGLADYRDDALDMLGSTYSRLEGGFNEREAAQSSPSAMPAAAYTLH